MNNFTPPMQSPQPTHTNPAKYKTMLCKHFQSPKGCSFGDKCQFAHGMNELRTQPGMNPMMNQMRQQPKRGTNSQNYKIVKCKYFERDGTCRYGTLCSFAHGDAELRKKSDNLMNAPDMMMDPMSMFMKSPYMPQQFDPSMMMTGLPNMGNMPPNMTTLGNMQNMGNIPNMSMGKMPNMNMPGISDNDMMKNFNMFMMQNQLDPLNMINKPQNDNQNEQKEDNFENDENKDKK